MVKARMSINAYTNRVLGVIKERYGLKDKSEALDKFAEMFGDEFVDKEVKDKVIMEVLASCEKHMARYGNRKMTLKELDRLCGIE